MNPFASRVTGNSWVVPVATLSVVLIVLIRLAWITPANLPTRAPLLSPDQERRVQNSFTEFVDENKKIKEEIEKLRKENTDLQNAMGSKTSEAKLLNDSLQELKVFAALTEAEGPGISVTLKDAPSSKASDIDSQSLIIHDIDVLKVVNELWAAGSDAISVNGNRVSIRSSYRCVGNTILVDRVPISSPVVIRAIGDPDTLIGGLNIPMGVLDELRSVDEGMVHIEKVKNMKLKPYAGSTSHQILKVPKDAQ